MSPAVVRRRPAACADALLAWLLELHSATSEADSLAGCDTIAPALTRLQRVVDEPAVTELLARAGELVAPLQQAMLPRAFAHGDLSAPNILVSEDGVLGVVDWELAEPSSLPAQDLFFALCYLALARARARDTEQCVRAFRHAFFGRQAWAQSYIERFARQADLDPALLMPLFVACWTRYLAERCVRLEDAGLPPDALRSSLLQNRYFAMWSYAVRHADEFRPHDHRIVSGSYASNLSIFSAR
jgi:aminoglycoside phosphotransferase (APT) family kinase protein